MSPAAKYSLGRIGIFVGVALPMLVPTDNMIVKLLLAVVVSAVLSFFLLRPWREEFAQQLSVKAQQRLVDRERLRSALAGEDDGESPTTGTPPSPAP